MTCDCLNDSATRNFSTIGDYARHLSSLTFNACDFSQLMQFHATLGGASRVPPGDGIVAGGGAILVPQPG